MSQTFEELVCQELDSLYQGALFLAAGDEHTAERLLTRSVTRAFEARSAEADGRLLERSLARVFVDEIDEAARSVPEPGSGTPKPVGQSLPRLDGGTLFSAAGDLPRWPRAALWLVLLRRWGYGDAARALGIEDDSLRQLLAYRDVLFAEVLERAQGDESGAGRELA